MTSTPGRRIVAAAAILLLALGCSREQSAPAPSPAEPRSTAADSREPAERIDGDMQRALDEAAERLQKVELAPALLEPEAQKELDPAEVEAARAEIEAVLEDLQEELEKRAAELERDER